MPTTLGWLLIGSSKLGLFDDAITMDYMTVSADHLEARRRTLHVTLRLPGKWFVAMRTHRTIGIRSLATVAVAVAVAFAFVISAAVNAQHEVASTVETAVVTGPEGTCEFHRRGTSVVAFVTTPDPRPVETSGIYCQVPEGFRPLTQIWHEVAAYVGHPRTEEAARANLIKYVRVNPDGSIASGGGVLETMVDVILRGRIDVVTDGISFELDWFTATDTVEGTFANLAEHHDGHFNLARGGTFVRAHLSTDRSPVQYWARQVPAVLFLVPEDFRPHIPVVRAVEGVAVDTHGVPVNPPRVIDFEITVTPDGAVRYQDGPHLDGVGYLAYELDTAWETAMSPDRAVLEEIRAASFPATFYGWDPIPTWGVDDVPLAQWEGVSTDAYGRVTNLDVRAGGSGPLPRSIGQLSALRRLKLGPVGFEQPVGEYGPPPNRFLVPDSLADLAQLETLILNEQSLTDGLVVALSRLANLRWLSLNETGITGPLPTEWSALRHLEVLDLCPVQASGHLPSSWVGMTSLKRLNICSPNLEGPLPAAWGQLANLKWLGLGGTGITGPLPPEWSKLRHLEVLSVGSDSPNLGRLPAAWGQLANLRLLKLDGTGISGRLPPEWSTLRRLEKLDLCETGIRGHVPPSWSGMTSLEQVDICSRFLDVKGPLPPEWGRMPRLEVYLDNHKVDLTVRRQQYFRDLLRAHALEPSPRTAPCYDGYVSYVYYCKPNGFE